MNWLVYSADQCEVLQFVFNDQKVETTVKRTIAIKLIEQANQIDFAKIVKEEEESWVIESHEQGKVEENYMGNTQTRFIPPSHSHNKDT